MISREVAERGAVNCAERKDVIKFRSGSGGTPSKEIVRVDSSVARTFSADDNTGGRVNCNFPIKMPNSPITRRKWTASIGFPLSCQRRDNLRLNSRLVPADHRAGLRAGSVGYCCPPLLVVARCWCPRKPRVVPDSLPPPTRSLLTRDAPILPLSPPVSVSGSLSSTSAAIS